MNINYLYTPVIIIIDHLIDTHCHELPLEKLQWEDFEKLCLAIVQIDFSKNNCEIYGVKGQAQEGIDIYARQANGRYSSYQCKRYLEFGRADLDKADSYFKSKKFYSQSDSLYLDMTILLSKITWYSSGARWELKCAKEEGVPVIGMHVKKNNTGAIPPELKGKRIIEWTWGNLEKSINQM